MLGAWTMQIQSGAFGQVVAVEQQAYGRTSDVARHWPFGQTADDTATLLRHLKIERSGFFGKSQAGGFTPQIRIRYHER